MFIAGLGWREEGEITGRKMANCTEKPLHCYEIS